MAKTLFENGTPLTPETLNRLNNPTYAENPSNDGEIPYPPANLIPEIAALQEGLAQEAVTRDSGFRANSVAIEALQEGLTQEAATRNSGFRANSTAIEALQDGLEQEAATRNSGFRANSTAIEALQRRMWPTYARIEVVSDFTPVADNVYEIVRTTTDVPAVIAIGVSTMADGDSFIVVGRGMPGSSLDSAISFPYAWGDDTIVVPLAKQALSGSIRLIRCGSGYIPG